MANGRIVSLEERKYLHKYADRDQRVASWLHKARRQQLQRERSVDPLENLLDGLSLGPLDPDTSHLGDDDLGEFFLGAPSWLGRS